LLILASITMFFVGGVLMLVYNGHVHDGVVTGMRKYMREYTSRNADTESDAAIKAWDEIQQKAS
jgi:hypothetical protein